VPEKKKRVVKKAETLRERTEKKSSEANKASKSRRVVGAAKKPIQGASRAGKKEFHPIKLPDNKLGNLLSKRVRFVPKYFRDAWAEIKQVQWPNRKETTKLTTAVLMFALVFSAIVYVLDLGLDRLFRELILGS
jgi:preprotein translocase SecE subunit